MDLQNKIAVVTGSSSGLGAATARKLVQKGVTVYGLARTANILKNMEVELGEGFIGVALDVSKEADLNRWIDKTFSASYFPQIIINNAGVSKFEEVDQLSSKNWHQMIDTNLSAVHFMTAGLVPFLKKDKNSSHIINIGSILGKVSGSKKSAYSATKFAIQGYSEALFKELRSYNIKVSCLNSGSINTTFFKTSGIEANAKMLQADKLADILIFMLQTPDNVLIDELTVRPLQP